MHMCVCVCVCVHAHVLSHFSCIWLFAMLWTVLQVQKALLEWKEVISDTNMSASLALLTGFQWAGSWILSSVRGHDQHVRACWVASVVSNCLQPYGLQPASLLCPWDSPGKNTGMVRILCPPPGDLPSPGIKLKSLMSPALAGVLYH